MSNPFITRALARLAGKKDVKDLAGFWDLVGRADLRNSTYESLAGASSLQTLHYEASRVVARRNKRVLEMNDGRRVEVVKKEDQKPGPIMSFTHVNHTGTAHFYQLRETKGWVRERIDADECEKYYEVHDVDILKRLPPGAAFDRWRVAA